MFRCGHRVHRDTPFSPSWDKEPWQAARGTSLWHRSWDMSFGDSDLRSNCCSKSAEEEFEPVPHMLVECLTRGAIQYQGIWPLPQCLALISNAPFCVLPPRACITDSAIDCGGGLKQRLSPEAWRALRAGAQLWVCTWWALKKVKHWCCCRRLNQYFCNSLLKNRWVRHWDPGSVSLSTASNVLVMHSGYSQAKAAVP